MRQKLFPIGFVLLACLLFQGCGAWFAAEPANVRLPPAASPLPSDTPASEAAIRFLEDRVKKDPDDFIALNKLGAYYLQRLRETGNLGYLKLARRTAEASMRAMPKEQNAGGLRLLAQVDYASHNFTAARDEARDLTRIEDRRGYPFQLLADALLELGDYSGAGHALRSSERLETVDAGMAARLGRQAVLRGQTQQARNLFVEAIELAIQSVPPSRESVAWCRWQLAELDFSVGDYDAAEKGYQESLHTFPDYYRGLAGLARTRAAKGDVKGAIEQYQRAVSIVPDPGLVGAMGDLYELEGRSNEARAQFALVEKIAKIGEESGSLHDRQLANFYADHDLHVNEAYTMARREYQVRRDVYGADSLAWTALKAGHLAEAREAIAEALRLGTRDARLYYHAGMIARAAGNIAEARQHLKRALELNPEFDPRQAPLARAALSQ